MAKSFHPTGDADPLPRNCAATGSEGQATPSRTPDKASFDDSAPPSPLFSGGELNANSPKHRGSPPKPPGTLVRAGRMRPFFQGVPSPEVQNLSLLSTPTAYTCAEGAASLSWKRATGCFPGPPLGTKSNDRELPVDGDHGLTSADHTPGKPAGIRNFWQARLPPMMKFYQVALRTRANPSLVRADQFPLRCHVLLAKQ